MKHKLTYVLFWYFSIEHKMTVERKGMILYIIQSSKKKKKENGKFLRKQFVWLLNAEISKKTDA